MTQEKLEENARIIVRTLEKIEAEQINNLITIAKQLRNASGRP